MNPEGVTFDGEWLWTADWAGSRILRIREWEFGMLVDGQFTGPEDGGPTVGLGCDGEYLWLTCFPNGNYEFGQLYKLDHETLEVVWMHELETRWIEDLAWDGQYLWSADWLFGEIFAIRP